MAEYPQASELRFCLTWGIQTLTECPTTAIPIIRRCTFSTDLAAYPNLLGFGKKKPQLMGHWTHKYGKQLNFCSA